MNTDPTPTPAPTKPGPLQRLSVLAGLFSFLLTGVSMVLLYFQASDTGFNNPVSASLAACCFFFTFVGVVLTVVGRSNLPSFSFDPDDT